MMKNKLIIILLIILSCNIISAQEWHIKGAKFPNATNEVTLERIPVMDPTGIVNGYITKDQLASDITPDLTNYLQRGGYIGTAQDLNQAIIAHKDSTYVALNGKLNNTTDTLIGDLTVTGNITAEAFIGDGSQLTGLPSGVSSFQDLQGDPYDNAMLSDALNSKANDNEVVKTDPNSLISSLTLALSDSITIASGVFGPNAVVIDTTKRTSGGDEFVTGGSLSGAGVLTLNRNYGSPIQIPGFNSGSGGTASWGGIGGDINLQSDMMGLFAGKANTSHTHNASDINAGILPIARIPTGTTGSSVSLGNHLHTGVYEAVFSKNTAFNKNFGTASGTVLEGNWRPTWTDVTGKPTTFAPSAHTHPEYWKSDGTSTASGNWDMGSYQFKSSTLVSDWITIESNTGDASVWNFNKDAGDSSFRIWRNNPYTAEYIFDSDGIPHNPQSVITKSYADANYGGGGTGVGDMLKSVYDTNNNNIVDNSTQLNGQSAAYYLAFGNFTGTVSAAQIANSAISQAKISATGTATNGKLLGTNGTGLQWVSPSSSPYNSLVMTVSQTGTNNPALNILENSTGATFTATRTDVGKYTITASLPILAVGKVFLNYPFHGVHDFNGSYDPVVITTTTTTITIQSRKGSTFLDDVIRTLPIEVRIYP